MNIKEATQQSKSDLCDTNTSLMQKAAIFFRDKYIDLVELYIESKLENQKLKRRLGE